MNTEQIIEQQEKDREELAKLPPNKNKPLSWCSEHDCQMGTCFPLHYPESSVFKVVLDEDVRKAIKKQIDDQENWVKLWKQSR